MLATTPELLVRWMQPADVAGLVTLFADCYPAEQWKARDFRRFVANRERDNVVKVLVDETDRSQRILAAIAYTADSEMCLIRRLAVPTVLRRQGFATEILSQTASRRSPIQRRVFKAVVSETNLTAQLFFRDSAVGFNFDRDERHWYADGRQGYVFRFLKAPRRRRVLVSG